MWIDAVCIDQSNISERSHQVMLIREIYTNAETVDIWLGSDAALGGEIVEFLEMAGRDIDPKQRLLSSLETNAEVNKDLWKAILLLFKREYWKRVWIIQEVTCGANLKILFRTL